jgi:hypothetical protein
VITVVPLACDTIVEGGSPINGHSFIVVMQKVEEVIDMVFADILDGKVVNHKAEHDRLECVAPKAWSRMNLIIAMFG